MRMFALPLAAALFATTAVAFGAYGDVRVNDTDLHAPLDGKKALDISNIEGSIELTQVAGSTVTIHAHATAHRSDPAIAKIDVRSEDDKIVVCVRYPHTTCGNEHGGSHYDDSEEHDDVNVDLTIGVPRDLRVSAQTVEGGVTAGALADTLHASVVNGPIKIASLGSVRAQTVNGPIEARVSLGAGDDGDFQTVNGLVHVIFASGADAAISAKTLSGNLSGDGVTLIHGDEGFVGHNATAKIGNGSARVSIQTVAGSIRVSKS